MRLDQWKLNHWIAAGLALLAVMATLCFVSK